AARAERPGGPTGYTAAAGRDETARYDRRGADPYQDGFGRDGNGYQRERGYDGTAAYALNQGPDPAYRPNGGFDDLYRGAGRVQDGLFPGTDEVEDDAALHGVGSRRIGSMPAWMGAAVIVGGALLGLLVALVGGGQPAQVLGLVGVFVIIATIAAGVLVRSGATYLLIPLPAPAFALVAVIIGLLKDHVALSSHTALAVSAAQWAADGFFSMVIATAAAVGMTAVRLAADWVYHRRSAGVPVSVSPAPRRGHGSRGTRATVAPRNRAATRARLPGQDSPRQDPPSRGARSDRPGNRSRLGAQDLAHAAVGARMDDHRIGPDVPHRGEIRRVRP
ncbi:MAG: hypothetical protein M0030_08005, partial [Actinomycetota bacterium]|nr:hypothetical protein [Actinomycetota bacterium]